MKQHYEKVLLNHANLKRPVHIVAGTIAFWHFAESTQCTHIYTTAGILPVVESPEQIDEILFNMPSRQGETNV